LWSELGTTQRDLFDQEVIEGSGGAYQITDDVLRRLERRKADVRRKLLLLRIYYRKRKDMSFAITSILTSFTVL
jgi:hypothetical protein